MASVTGPGQAGGPRDHLGPEELARYDPATAPAASREHLQTCPACAAELEQWLRVAGIAEQARSVSLDKPPAQTWEAVLSELAARQPRRRLRTAVAAAAGLVVGIGATLGVLALRNAAGAPDVLAHTTLTALPGQSGDGSVELARIGSRLQVRVDAHLAVAPTQDFYEVWLINGDGHRMYALGTLPATGQASYWVPSVLGDQLDGYATVDVSLEPDNGDPTHSRHSLIRGQLG